jgi:hypothetical protein
MLFLEIRVSLGMVVRWVFFFGAVVEGFLVSMLCDAVCCGSAGVGKGDLDMKIVPIEV